MPHCFKIPRARSSAHLVAALVAVASIAAPAIAYTAPAVKVQGNHLVDGSGNTLQLRGVNVSGLEFVAVQGWDATNPWGNQTGTATPNWNAIKAWKANTIRLPLNEASWLGLSCKDASGKIKKADPGANYRATVHQSVADATAAGLYVIIDLHWTAPGDACPMAQNQMADADHSVAFWQSVAGVYKGNTNVIFELFNEPYINGSNNWSVIMQGGTESSYITGGTPWSVNYKWQVAGMQQLLDAVRSAGARNVVLVGSANWSQDLSGWVTNKPNDPAHQMAASWHPYPDSSDPNSSAAALPSYGSEAYAWAQGILDAGYPVVVSETGDRNASGTQGAPLLERLLPWADAHSVSYLGWAWDLWGDSNNVLIKDAAGDPTDGYGIYFRQQLLCRAANNCAASSTPTSGSGGSGSGSNGSSSGTFWVYSNGTFNWGGDYSAAAKANYRSSAGAPQSGSYDIAVTVTSQWGLWLPYAGGTVPLWNFDASSYKYLTLDLKPTVANQVWQLFFIMKGDIPIVTSSGAPEVVNLADYGPAPQVGKWATYKIPLSAVLTQHSGGKATLQTAVYKFGLQDQTGRSSNLWYVDNVGFTN